MVKKTVDKAKDKQLAFASESSAVYHLIEHGHDPLENYVKSANEFIQIVYEEQHTKRYEINVRSLDGKRVVEFRKFNRKHGIFCIIFELGGKITISTYVYHRK